MNANTGFEFTPGKGNDKMTSTITEIRTALNTVIANRAYGHDLDRLANILRFDLEATVGATKDDKAFGNPEQTFDTARGKVWVSSAHITAESVTVRDLIAQYVGHGVTSDQDYGYTVALHSRKGIKRYRKSA